MTDNNGGLMLLMTVFPVIKAHASQSYLSRRDHRLDRAMSDRICPKIRRDTATSAIWNVTYRPWRTG